MKIRDVNISANGLAVLKRRYLIKDKLERIIETPTQLFVRVAQFVAEADRNYGVNDDQVNISSQKFFDIMTNLEFLPNSPTLMNAGRPLGQLSACFVLPVNDSMEDIFESIKHAALIHKSGGGTGFSFSRLRPRNSIVASTSGVASGPVSFMKAFNATTETVRQGGTRRGANMGVLRVDHPDIMEFIACKDNTNEVTNFNISIAITDAFMEALANDGEYPLFNPHTNAIHLIDGQEARLRARDVFDSIVEHAWRTGEPGVIFLDRMNRHNPTYPDEIIEATNPCGEQPLPPYDSCNLGSVNLSQFALNPLPDDYTPSNPSAGINWEKLASVVGTSVHFLDNIIDKNQYPIKQIEKQTLKNRRIGLGIMGLADLLVKLGLPYNSTEAQELGGQIMDFVGTQARNYSSELAKTRGKFSNWEHSVFGRDNIAMRNATVTTIAPTGTISIIAGCSSGIEPYYAIAFERNILDGNSLTELNPLFENIARKNEFYNDELVATIATKHSLSDIDGIPDSVKAIFLTAADISPEDHVRMQAQFQKYCDSSVSKTINLPESATQENIARAFNLAFELECKGVTVYRDKSRPYQVLSTHKVTGETQEKPAKVEKRPDILQGVTEKIRTGYGNLYVTINVRNGIPFEVFAHIGKSGYTTMADTEAICRLISLSLRSHIPVEVIINQLRGIGGSSQTFSGGSKIFSIPDAIAQVLNRHFVPKDSKKFDTSGANEICPECGGVMIFSSGCFSCPSCGYSNC
ncbi:MAG: vitamin B12-dependent ribonucleotide reductase [candidate division Zixibacteria bacterium]|nr:vitamin B12-dependent ribonucleotide reductase [candidate division Zixibacteria bacterium]